jgi:hypothetical protein
MASGGEGALESAVGFVFTKPLATPRFGSMLGAARRRPLGSYFQTRPMASGGEGAPIGGWVRFYKTVGDPEIRLDARRGASHWVRIFKLAQWHPGPARSNRRLGLFLQAATTP